MAQELILIVEKNNGQAPTFADALARRGYRVEVVSTGKSAVELGRERLPALVVVNAASMGSNGTRICDSLVDELGVAVIHILPKEGVHPELGDLPCGYRLSSPLSERKLLRHVRQQLGESNPFPPLDRLLRFWDEAERNSVSQGVIVGLGLIVAAIILAVFSFLDIRKPPAEVGEAVPTLRPTVEQQTIPTTTETPITPTPQPPGPTLEVTPPQPEELLADTPEPELLTPELPIDPGFDPEHPFRFCSADGGCVDLLETETDMMLGMVFAGATTVVKPVLPQANVNWEEYFPLCGSNILVTNAKDGHSETEVWYKTIIYAHSGRCRGRWLTAEYLRNYLEGGYFVPSTEQRDTRLQDIRGQVITMDQGIGVVTFEIVDAVYLEEEDVTEYAADPGSLDRFFPTGVQPGKHEIFLIFCGSIGPLQSGNPLDFFTARYILRLQILEEAGDTGAP